MRLRGRPTTLSIYQDPVADCEVPLQAAIPAPMQVTDCEVPSQAVSQAAPRVRYSRPYFKGFLSVFELWAGPYSLRLMTHKCKSYTASHFIQEAVNLKQECLLFKSCCKKGDASLEPLKGVPPYLQSLYKSQSTNGQHFCQNICFYNNVLVLTSVSYTKDTRIDFLAGV